MKLSTKLKAYGVFFFFFVIFHDADFMRTFFLDTLGMPLFNYENFGKAAAIMSLGSVVSGFIYARFGK